MVGNPRLSITMLMLATASFGMFTSNHWAVTQALAGPKSRGTPDGIENFLGNLTGILQPTLTGFIVNRTGNLYWAFIMAAGMVFAAPVRGSRSSAPLHRRCGEMPVAMIEYPRS